MRIILIISGLFLSSPLIAKETWWVFSGVDQCKIAEYSPWQILELGVYQLDKFFKDKGLVFLEHKENPNNMLIFSKSQQNCNAVAEIVKQAQHSMR